MSILNIKVPGCISIEEEKYRRINSGEEMKSEIEAHHKGYFPADSIFQVLIKFKKTIASRRRGKGLPGTGPKLQRTFGDNISA